MNVYFDLSFYELDFPPKILDDACIKIWKYVEIVKLYFFFDTFIHNISHLEPFVKGVMDILMRFGRVNTRKRFKPFRQ